jgi:hypothetical protein
MGIVLCLDHGQWDVGLEVKDIIGALALAATDQLAAHDDTAFGEAYFLADLQHLVPTRFAQGWRDELGADIALAESPDRKGLSGWGERDSEGLSKPSQEPRCGPQPLGGSIAARACVTKPI